MDKLQIGDIIKWNVRIGAETLYEIIDIDKTHPPDIVGNGKGGFHEFPSEVRLKYTWLGKEVLAWGYGHDGLSDEIGKAISIVGRVDKLPRKKIKRFKL